MENLEIREYSIEYEKTWDDLVMFSSANGTIFHTRKFLNYHGEKKFKDVSILFFLERRVIAVFPACLENNIVYSHKGSSCGGPVIHANFYKYSYIKVIIEKINNHYFNNSLIIKIPESIFFEVNNDSLLYEYYKSGYKITPELGAYKEVARENLLKSINRNTSRRYIRKLTKEGYQFYLSNDQKDYLIYHKILSDNLLKFNTSPTHDLKSFILLTGILSDKQFLVVAKDLNGDIIAGVWIIKATINSWHTQYIARDYNYQINGIIEATLFKCFELAKEHNVDFLNLGINTENKGSYLNEKLLTFKEGLGTKHINRYIIESK